MNIVSIVYALLVVTGAGLIFFSIGEPFSETQAIVGVLLVAIAMLLGRFYRD
ncbi:MAG TPA: hypothetical protein G4O13_09025 [Dehalococcoidia bacterium]|nr:hypothetical protein [Dehalococcoidia bacterium]